MKLKKWSKLIIEFGIVIMYYAVVQLAYTVNYIHTLKFSGIGVMEVCANILQFILLFAPIVIFIFRLGIQESKKNFFTFYRKYWIIYLIYLLALYLIRENITLGYYYIEFCGVSKSVSSPFLMAYMYMLFESTISILFLTFLPNYIIIFRKWSETSKAKK